MLVYGDAARRIDPRVLVRRLSAGLRRLACRPAGLERHAELVGLFILAGELTQGLADHGFHRHGRDGDPGPHDAAMALLMALAAAVGTSWRGAFMTDPDLASAGMAGLEGTSLPASIEIRMPEGYAFYAVYPEGWYEAAASLAGLPVRVIGIRSIGTGLAAMLAAGSGAPPPLTVRPFGPPFRREVRIAPEALGALLDDTRACIAIADEGPGLSGSSFGAVSAVLESHGVDPGRLHLFPSHPGEPGPEADPSWRSRWRTLSRRVVDVDRLMAGVSGDGHRLATWAAPMVDSPVRTVEDVSAGRWRSHLRNPETDVLPVDPRAGRRKFLIRTEDTTWLAKFAGLGRIGSGKLRLAGALHAAGYVAEPRGLAHGFLIERWHEEAEPMVTPPSGAERADFLAHLAGYLAFRGRHFPARSEAGASLERLALAARINAATCLEGDACSELEDRLGRWSGLEPPARRVRTDNRLHTWEWLRMPDGRLLKADALDHHAGHDLVGCQDIAWDVAGAGCEFSLAGEELEELRRRVEVGTGSAVPAARIEAYGVLYPAFQFGAFSLAADALPGSDEAPGLRVQAMRYAERLRDVLGDRT